MTPTEPDSSDPQNSRGSAGSADPDSSHPPSAPSPRDQRSVRAAYDTVAAAYAAHFPGTQPETALELAMVEELGRRAATLDDGRILDAGCGTGRMSRYLAARGCRVEGCDLSPAMVEEARAAAPGIAVQVGSLTALPYADASFSGVLAWYSSIHTARDAQPAIWAEVARVLRPGGVVLVGFQAGAGVRDVAPVYARFGYTVELMRYRYSVDEVSTFLAAAGLVEQARLLRRAQGPETDDQAAVLASRPPPAPAT